MGRAITYGELALVEDRWELTADAHVMVFVKRMFERVSKGEFGTVSLQHTLDNCRMLDWFLIRYPCKMTRKSRTELRAGAREHKAKAAALVEIMRDEYIPKTHELAKPLRRYQAQAVDLYLAQGYLLVGDDVGLGKTVIGIGSLTDPRTLPALVVPLTHLPQQWKSMIEEFAPGLFVHIAKTRKAYRLPTRNGKPPDVVIVNYAKLGGWAEKLAGEVKSVIFDEIQQLRRSGTQRYNAARHLARAADYVLGLSATPIYNRAGEIFYVCNVLKQHCLGTTDEFFREWCYVDARGRGTAQNPRALGTWLRENHVMIRRTRRDVGRELPEFERVTHFVESDVLALDEIDDSAGELARIIMDKAAKSPERWSAAGQFEMAMRQATGIAKAPYVAAFVRMLVESGEKVLLGGWHRAVYDIWESCLEGIPLAWYTGSESTAKKAKEAERFKAGEAQVMFMSLRSAQGLDGLQHSCRMAVFGELDWCPGIHEQFTGRILRDGQREPVTAFYLVSNAGADPFIADTLGLKRQQLQGIRDPEASLFEKLQGGGPKIKEMAAALLKGRIRTTRRKRRA